MEGNIIPNWIVITGSLFGLLLGIFKIINWFDKLTKLPDLDVALTKELFFRLTNTGENVFTNCVLIARNGPVEITDVNFTLKRISGSQKTFNISPVHMGNKIADPPNPYAAHNFTSKSCRMYLAENAPCHILYLSVLEEYSGEFKNETSKFDSSVLDYANELKLKLPEIEAKGVEYFAEINSKLTHMETEAKGKILSLVQLESGNYELEVKVSFLKLGVRIFNDKGISTNKITFSVEENLKELYSDQLQRALTTTAKNILFNQETTYVYPEYQPIKITES